MNVYSEQPYKFYCVSYDDVDFLDLKCNCFVFINHLVLLRYIEVYIILLQ